MILSIEQTSKPWTLLIICNKFIIVKNESIKKFVTGNRSSNWRSSCLALGAPKKQCCHLQNCVNLKSSEIWFIQSLKLNLKQKNLLASAIALNWTEKMLFGCFLILDVNGWLGFFFFFFFSTRLLPGTRSPAVGPASLRVQVPSFHT